MAREVILSLMKNYKKLDIPFNIPAEDTAIARRTTTEKRVRSARITTSLQTTTASVFTQHINHSGRTLESVPDMLK